MANSIKSVAYSFCEGYDQPYALDCVVITDGKVDVNVHGKYATRQEFFHAISEVIPLFEGGDPEESAVLEEYGDHTQYQDVIQ